MTRKGNAEIQLALFCDYQNNLSRYAELQEYFRRYQPPALIVRGKNDYIFPAIVHTPINGISTTSSSTCSIPGISPWSRTVT